MTVPHKKFCVLPWISLEASPIGTVRPCCLADGEITNTSGEKYNLTQHLLQDIQHSEYMHGLRRQFLQGEQPELCRRCWAEEDSGRTSKRMHTLDRLKHIDIGNEWTESAKPLRFLDLKLGNICNIACRICGSWSSSTYATEELQQLPDVQQRRQSFAYMMNRAGAWPRDNELFWQGLATNSQDIRYLEFTGGEPFMIQQHFDYLEQLVQHGHSSNIEIHYNTNGTIFPESAPIWKNFKHVEIAFSIDDLGARFEYQRYGANWQRVNENLVRFQQLRTEMAGRLTLQVCSTVNVFNVMYLEDLATWIDQQGFDFVYWNMLHDAPQHCITSLPTQVKQQVQQRLLTAQVTKFHQQEFEKIVTFMNSRQTDSQTLLEDIEKLDRRRRQNIRDYLPELAELLYA